MLLVSASSQDVGAEVQLQLQICCQDLFLPLSKTMECGTQNREVSSDDRHMDSQEVSSTSQEPPQPLTLTQKTVAKHMGPHMVFSAQGPRPERPTTCLPHPSLMTQAHRKGTHISPGHTSAVPASHSSTQSGEPGAQGRYMWWRWSGVGRNGPVVAAAAESGQPCGYHLLGARVQSELIPLAHALLGEPDTKVK